MHWCPTVGPPHVDCAEICTQLPACRPSFPRLLAKVPRTGVFSLARGSSSASLIFLGCTSSLRVWLFCQRLMGPLKYCRATRPQCNQI